MTAALSSGSRWIAIVLQLIALQALTPSATAQSPDIAFHDLEWYVHDSLITGATPMSFYEDLIARASVEAGILLMGNSGPFDSPCCVDFSAVSIDSFSDIGGNTWDSIDSRAEIDNLDSVDSTGHRVFIVGDITFCSGPGAPIGCADTPPVCGSDPPNLVIVIDIEAETLFNVFANTLAHERGHNSCLGHVDNNPCEIMKGSSGGGCFSASECDEYRVSSTSTGGTCACHTAAGVLEVDGESCSQGAVTGICSGGACGEVGSDASVTLLASADTEGPSENPATTDDPLLMSALPGGWTDLGEFNSSHTPQGLTWSDDAAKAFGVAPTAGDDVLLEIDPTDGSATVVGTITGLQDLSGLAYDPGPTSSTSDDRLFAIDSGTFGPLYEIDPVTAVSTLLGSFSSGVTGGFNSLAYDSKNDHLYLSTAFTGGIYEIDFSSCCSLPITVVSSDGPVRFDSGLAYGSGSNVLYVIGRQSDRTLYDTLDADELDAGTISMSFTRSLDGFTIGGLAATPVPEPGFGIGALTAGLCLWGASRLRRS